MAFFKFRKGGDESSATPLLPDTLEAMRRRAKFRLIGSAVLVLIGVIGFPMLFDKQPRPVAVDMPIEIPERNKVKPLAIPAPAPAPAPVAVQAPTPEPAASAVPALPATPVAAVISEPKAPLKPANTASVAINKVATPAPVVAAKPAAKVDEGSKAQALLDGRSIDKSTEAIVGRFVVQVGAFADVTKAREARLKLEHAGLKTYTQVAETKEGRRIRVRVGPFGTKTEAEKAMEKVRQLKLPATLLTL